MIVQLVGTWTNGTIPHGTAAFETGAFTPPSNSLLLVAVSRMVSYFVGDLGQPVVSGGGLVYNLVGSARGEMSWAHRLDVFSAVVGTATSMVVSVDDDGDQEVYTYCVVVLAITGYDSAAPIAGIVGSGLLDIGGDAYTLTLTAAPGPDDAALVFVSNDADAAPSDPILAAGWSLLADVAVGGGGAGLWAAVRGGSTAADVSVTDVYTAAGPFYKGAALAFVVKAAVEVIPPLGQGDTPGFLLWCLAHSYYSQIVAPGLGAGPGEPTGANAAEWGGVFFGSP